MADWSQYKVNNNWSKYRVEPTKFVAQSPIELPTLSRPTSPIPTPIDSPNLFEKLWSKVNTPLAKETLIETGKFSTGRGLDLVNQPFASNIAASFTTPLSIGTMAAGPISKVAPMTGTILGRGLGAIQEAEGIKELAEGNIASGLINTSLGAIGLGQRYGALPKVAAPSKAIVPEVLPAEIIPGKRRLGAAPEPKGLLGPAVNAPIIPPPAPPPAPRFIAGSKGIAEAGKKYDAYLPDPPQFGKARVEDILDAPSPGKLDASLAAEYGIESAGRPADINLLRKRLIDTITQRLINRGYDRKVAAEFADKVAVEKYPNFSVERVPYGKDVPPKVHPPVYSGTGQVENFGETAIPGARAVAKPKVEEPFVSNYPKTGPVRTITDPKGKAAQEIIAAQKKVVSIAQSNPITANIVQYPKAIEEASKRIASENKFTRFAKNSGGQAIETELEKMGDAGRQVNLLLAEASTKARQRASMWDELYDEMESKFKSPEEQATLFDQIETGANIPEVQLNRAVDTQRTAMMNQAGIKNPETGLPFQPKENYTPRIYPEGFWKDPKNIYSAIKQEYPNMPDDIAIQISLGKAANLEDRIMQSAKVSRDVAKRIINLGRETSERKIASQFSRKLNLPGYRKDLKTFKEHNWDIAKKTAESEVFGPLDTADPNSPLSKLIEQTPNPAYTRELVDIQLGRRPKGYGEATFEDIGRAAARFSGAIYLSMFPISNTANLMTIPLRAGMKNFTRALIGTSRANRHTIAKESGAMYNITRGILELEGSKFNPISKGITASENFNRSVAAVAGRLQAEDLFAGLKAGKLNPQEVKFLEDLTLKSPNELLKQGELSVEQLRNAGGRMAELTQGLGEARKVPAYWNSGYFQLPLVFKKYAFQQTKILKDAIKADPIRTIPMLAAASQVVGETIGDIKQGVYGTVESAITGENKVGERIARRGEWIGQYKIPGIGNINDPTIQRMIDNVVQSWALGLVSDLFFISMGDAREMPYNLSGPAIQTGADLYNAGREATKGNITPLIRETTKRIPYIGPGLQRAFAPTNFQKSLPSVRPPSQ